MQRCILRTTNRQFNTILLGNMVTQTIIILLTISNDIRQVLTFVSEQVMDKALKRAYGVPANVSLPMQTEAGPLFPFLLQGPYNKQNARAQQQRIGGECLCKSVCRHWDNIQATQ